MAKIIRTTNLDTRAIESFNPGDTFEYNEVPYVVLAYFSEFSNVDTLNLETGTVTSFKLGTLVTSITVQSVTFQPN